MKRNWRRPSDENSAPHGGDRQSGMHARSRSMERSNIPRPTITPKIPGSRTSSESGGVGGMNRFSRVRPVADNQGSSKRSVSVGRASMAPGPSRMRSSTSNTGIGGNHVRHSSGGLSSNKPLTDSRNLSEKAVRQKCARDVQEFLITNGYPNQTNLRDLSQGPSSTEFWRIFEFLYRIVDEEFKFGPNDDKQQIFLDNIKNIGYPFNISNSHLKTIGSPHSWPYLLGVLHWMLHPLRTMFQLDAVQILVVEDVNPLQKLRWQFIEDTYDAFMDGEDNMHPHLSKHEEVVKNLIHGPNGGASALKAELERLTRKREVIENEADPVEEVQKHLNMVEEDKCKLEKYMTDKKSYAEKLSSMVLNFEGENVNLKKQSANMTDDQERLQKIYDAQEMTPAELQKINLERGELRQRNKEALKRKEEVAENLGSKQIEIAKIRGESEKIVMDFNVRAREARFIPETNENAFGFDLALSTSTPTSEIAGRLKEALTQLAKTLRDKSNNLEVEIDELKQNLEEWEDRLKANHQELSTKGRRLETLDAEYEQRKRDVALEMETLRRVGEEAAKEIADLRFRLTAFNSTEGEIRETCRVEGIKFEQIKKKHAKELEDAMNALTRLCHMAIEHKESVNRRKKEALEEKREALSKLNNVVREQDEWRTAWRAELDIAKRDLKKKGDECREIADKAIKEHELFMKEYEMNSQGQVEVGLQSSEKDDDNMEMDD